MGRGRNRGGRGQWHGMVASDKRVLTVGKDYKWTYGEDECEDGWKQFITKIKEVVVDDGQNWLGSCALKGCTELTGVSVSDGGITEGGSPAMEAYDLTGPRVMSGAASGDGVYIARTPHGIKKIVVK